MYFVEENVEKKTLHRMTTYFVEKMLRKDQFSVYNNVFHEHFFEKKTILHDNNFE